MRINDARDDARRNLSESGTTVPDMRINESTRTTVTLANGHTITVGPGTVEACQRMAAQTQRLAKAMSPATGQQKMADALAATQWLAKALAPATQMAEDIRRMTAPFVENQKALAGIVAQWRRERTRQAIAWRRTQRGRMAATPLRRFRNSARRVRRVPVRRRPGGSRSDDGPAGPPPPACVERVEPRRVPRSAHRNAAGTPGVAVAPTGGAHCQPHRLEVGAGAVLMEVLR